MEINTVSKNKALVALREVIEFGNIPIGLSQIETIEL